ncbi:MAG: FkbM family methyltransferase [Planctomycetes bacterium]|nr:FkbM family methyltransferase [Planctomycetota bacterium]
MALRRWKRLFSWPRYRRCRRVFRHPLLAHIHLSGVHRRTFRLAFRHGGALRFSRSSWRQLWSFLLADEARADSLRAAAGCIEFNHEGLVIALRPEPADFAVFQEIFLDDVYAIAALPPTLGTVVDLGANIGLFSLRLAARARRILAVEPIAANRAMAARQFATNGVAQRLALRGEAMGASSGRPVRLWHSPAGGATHSCLASVARVSGAGAWEEIPAISLPDLLDREGITRVDLLKCDMEGAEYGVLLSTSPEVLGRIARIVLEAHVTPEIPAASLERLRAHLRRASFELEERPLAAVGPVQPCLIRAHRAPPAASPPGQERRAERDAGYEPE